MINPQSVNQDIKHRSEILEMRNIKLVLLGSVNLEIYPGLGTRIPSLCNSFLRRGALCRHPVGLELATAVWVRICSGRFKWEMANALTGIQTAVWIYHGPTADPGTRSNCESRSWRECGRTRTAANHWLKWNKSTDMQGTWSRSRTLTPPEKRPVCLCALDTLEELFPCQNIHMPLTWVTDGMEFVSISGRWLIQCHVGYKRAASFC